MQAFPLASLRPRRPFQSAGLVVALIVWALSAAGAEKAKPDDAKADVEAHVQALASDDLDTRRQAVYALWQLGNGAQPAIPALARAVRDADDYVRTTAVKVLQRFRFDQAGAALADGFVELLLGAGDPRPAVRVDALRLVWHLGPMIQLQRPVPEALLPALRKGLADDDAMVRATAIGILLHLGAGGRELVPALKARVADADAEVRLWAVRALGALDPEGSVAELLGAVGDGDERVRADAFVSLGGLGISVPATVVNAIRTGLGDPVPAVRSAAANALWATETRKGVPELIRLLREDPDVTVRTNAARALGGLGAPAALEPLIAGTQNADVGLRAACATAIGQLGPEGARALPVLIAAVDSKDASVRWNALMGLGVLGHLAERALPHILQRLEDEDATVRMMASQALMQMVRADVRHDAILPALVNELSHPPAVRGSYGAQALVALGEDALPALDVLLERLDGPEPEGTKRIYVDVLGAIGAQAKEAAPRLRRALAAPAGDVYWRNALLVALARIRASDEDLALALERLGAALDDEEARRNAIWALGRLGSTAAPLAARIEHWMLAEEEPNLMVAGALLRIRGQHATRARRVLLEALATQPTWFVLQQFAEAGASQAVAAPRVVLQLDSTSSRMRAAAANALGRLGVKSEAILARLRKALQDPAATVRTAASLALRRLAD